MMRADGVWVLKLETAVMLVFMFALCAHFYPPEGDA